MQFVFAQVYQQIEFVPIGLRVADVEVVIRVYSVDLPLILRCNEVVPVCLAFQFAHFDRIGQAVLIHKV